MATSKSMLSLVRICGCKAAWGVLSHGGCVSENCFVFAISNQMIRKINVTVLQNIKNEPQNNFGHL